MFLFSFSQWSQFPTTAVIEPKQCRHLTSASLPRACDKNTITFYSSQNSLSPFREGTSCKRSKQSADSNGQAQQATKKLNKIESATIWLQNLRSNPGCWKYPHKLARKPQSHCRRQNGWSSQSILMQNVQISEFKKNCLRDPETFQTLSTVSCWLYKNCFFLLFVCFF